MSLRLVLVLALLLAGCGFSPEGTLDDVVLDADDGDDDPMTDGGERPADGDAASEAIDAAPPVLDAPPVSELDAAEPPTGETCGDGDDDDGDGAIDCRDDDCPGCGIFACCANGSCAVFC